MKIDGRKKNWENQYSYSKGIISFHYIHIFGRCVLRNVRSKKSWFDVENTIPCESISPWLRCLFPPTNKNEWDALMPMTQIKNKISYCKLFFHSVPIQYSNFVVRCVSNLVIYSHKYTQKITTKLLKVENEPT